MCNRAIAVPLKASRDLAPDVRGVLRMVWHMITLTLAVIALLFALAALPGAYALL